MSETPEAYLATVAARLETVRAATRFLSEEQRKSFDDDLMDVTRSAQLMQLLIGHMVVAVAGTQSAGKTLLLRNLYDLDETWLQDNEGRGEYLPVLLLEQEGLVAPKGVLVEWSAEGQELKERAVSAEEFNRRVTRWSTDLSIPVLKVPQRYFGQPKCGFLLLPGYERLTSINRRWQDLMRLALVASNACILVADASRLAMQQDEIVEDIRRDQLATVEPVIAVTKTEHDPEERREELRRSAAARFAVPIGCTVCTGTGENYVGSWREKMLDALQRHGGIGEEARGRQLKELQTFARKLDTVIAQAGLAVRAATRRDVDDEDAYDELLQHFDEAARDLREDYATRLAEDLHGVRSAAAAVAVQRYDDEEATLIGSGRWLFESLTRNGTSYDNRMNERLRAALDEAGAGAAFGERHAAVLDRVASRALKVVSLSAPPVYRTLPALEGRELTTQRSTGLITPEVANTIHELLPREDRARAALERTDRVRLKDAIGVLPALATGYLHVMQIGAAKVHAVGEHEVPAAPDVVRVLSDAQSAGDQLLGISGSFAKAMAGLLFVDVAADGDIDSIPALMKAANSLLVGSTTGGATVAATAGAATGTAAATTAAGTAGAAASGTAGAAAAGATGSAAAGTTALAAATPWILAGVAAVTVVYSVTSALNQHDAQKRHHIRSAVGRHVDYQHAEHLRRFDDLMIDLRKRLVHQLRSRLGLDEHVGDRFWAQAAIRDLREARTHFLEAARPLAA